MKLIPGRVLDAEEQKLYDELEALVPVMEEVERKNPNMDSLSFGLYLLITILV